MMIQMRNAWVDFDRKAFIIGHKGKRGTKSFSVLFDKESRELMEK